MEFIGSSKPSLRRLLVLLAVVALVEVLAIGLMVGRARAFALDGPVAALSASSVSAADRGEPLQVPEHGREPERDAGRHRSVEIERSIPITARPGAGRVWGTMPAGSRYYGAPLAAWVRDVSRDGRYGLVDVPFVTPHRSGWISLRGLDTSWTRISVLADVSEHRITVFRGDHVLFRAPAATGGPSSPTPVGRYFVTDRVPFPGGGPLGTFAFGISGIQPNLPPGWSGGDQLAIHGTNDQSSIGRSASAGCLRVAESILDRLRPLLRPGTPVIIRP